MWTAKPPYGTPLNTYHPMCVGLEWFAPCNEGGGSLVTDVVGGVNLTTSSGVVWSPGGSSQYGSGPAMVSAGQNVQAALPPSLQLQFPFTLITGFRRISGGAIVFQLFGLYTTNTGTGTYGSIVSLVSNALLGLLKGGVSGGSSPTVTYAVGVDYTLVGCFGATTYAFYMYSTGVLVGSASGAWTNSAPSYSGTSLIGFGAVTGFSSKVNSFRANFGGVLNRFLSPQDASAWGLNPWQIFKKSYGTELVGPGTPTPTPTPTSSSIDPSYIARARATTPVAAGAGTTVVSTRPGRLVQVLVTSTGSGSGGVLFYDSIAALSGTEVGYIPANAAAGSMYIFDLPVGAGIVVSNPANGPGMTVAWR